MDELLYTLTRHAEVLGDLAVTPAITHVRRLAACARASQQKMRTTHELGSRCRLRSRGPYHFRPPAPSYRSTTR